MCDPVTATVTALSIATAGVGIYSQNESAKAQSEMIQRQADSEREESLDSAEEEIGSRIREARERRARARVAAGESGAQGASYAAMVNQSINDQQADTALVQKNSLNQQRAINDRVEVAESQIKRVSGLEAGLKIANAGVSGLSAGKSLSSKIGKPPTIKPIKPVKPPIGRGS